MILRLKKSLAVSVATSLALVFSEFPPPVRHACEGIAASYRRWASHGGDGNYAGIPGQNAIDCLHSMPFRVDLAVEFIDGYLGYLQFQSTIEPLQSPPSGYISTSVDLLGRFETIRARSISNLYTNQYDFDQDIDYLISRANDGHLNVELCSQEIMHFEHGIPLVSISEDGKQLPKIYTLSDATLGLMGAKNISNLVEINGVDAIYYLESSIGVRLGYQDPDARYNYLFPSYTAGFSGKSSGGAWTTYKGSWPGAAHQILQFANGSNLTVDTTATWPSNNGPMVYENGEMLFEAACIPSKTGTFGRYPGSFYASPTYDLPPSGAAIFPSPVIHHPKNLILGYYLEKYNAEIAVLQIPTFQVGSEAREFTQTAVDFVKKAFKDGKKKLMIDLTDNGGGDLILAFDLIQILFPGSYMYSATRFRATELIGFMGQIFSAAAERNDTIVSDLPVHFQNAVRPDQKSGFYSWENMNGPVKIMDANMSNLFAAFNYSLASSNEHRITAYNSALLNKRDQIFKTDQIVLISNGICASTCAIFAELLMKHGVKSIAFGGRPFYGPMQTVGGVKGAEHWSLSQIDRYISLAHELAINSTKLGTPLITQEQLQIFETLLPPRLEDFALRFGASGGGGVNFRNAYGEGDDNTPIQFVYEAADCRLFYTAENYIRPETVWRAAANAMLMNGSCVEGSATRR
ncbi:peptidase S41 family protein [Phlyctema vagabunda]|uniref:Peptidase S41 family protein n=1 Tax=Phlyctema vagabunda TaxID=108571 RepID=A0ABR4PQ93_9HELO